MMLRYDTLGTDVVRRRYWSGWGELLCCLALMGCVAACGNDDDSSGANPTPTQTGGPTPTATPCQADASWVENPRVRTEVPNGGGTSFCDFHRFAWEDFLALVEPDRGGLFFDSYMPKAGVFDPSSLDPEQGDEPFAYGTELPIPPGCPPSEARFRALAPIVDKGDPSLGSVEEAGSNAAPLTDQNGSWMHYGIALNDTAYDFLTECQLYKIGCFDQGVGGEDVRFPDQSIVIKTAWMEVDEDTVDRSRFYVTKALVDPTGPTPDEQNCQEVTVALVGFHIMHKTPRHPEWIWSTFEHEDNVPDCSNPDGAPPGGGSWHFNDPDCGGGSACTENVYQSPCSSQECPASDFQSYMCGLDLETTCADVASCDPTTPCQNCYDVSCTEAPIPSQICRNFPSGWTLTRNESDDDLPAVDPQYTSLNQSVRSILADNESVWQHYNLIGTLWCTPPDGNAPGGMQCSRTGVLATADQVGQLQLSNSAMESYNQRLNCFSCHNGAQAPAEDAFPQADFSHLFADMVTAGNCDEGIPEFCPEGAPDGPTQ